jgi:iron(III) transport system permease protein
MLRRRTALALALPVAVGLLGYVVLPLGRSLWMGLDPEAMGAVFGPGGAGWRGLANSVGVSLATVVLGGTLGTTLAWCLWRYRLPFRNTLRVLSVVPLALPPLVGALAVWLLVGEGGVLPRLLQSAVGIDRDLPGLAGRGAVLAVHVYAFHVYYTLFVTAALARLDGALLDASADLGGSPIAAFRSVVLPALRPALVGASLVVFMLSMGSFTAPLLFAGDEPFLTTQVYNYKTNNYLDRAAAVAAVLAAVCVAFLLAAESRRPATVSLGRPPRDATPPRAGLVTRLLLLPGVVIVLVGLAMPVATVLLLSFVADGSWTTQVLPGRYTLDNYRALATDRGVFAPVASSLWMAGVATVAAVVFGLAIALVVVKSRLPGRGALRLISLLPFALPGPVVALALLVWFGGPSLWAGGAVLVGSVGLLPLAYAVRHLPLAVRATQASLEGFDDRLTEASADLGASGWTTLRRVVLPAIRPGVVAGGLLAFVSALGEFPASVLLYVFANRPIAVEVLSRMRAYDLGAAASYAVLLMLLVGLATALTRRLGESA